MGKKNWYVIDSIRGADASAVLYSITETAKMNNLKPWSDSLPDICRKDTGKTGPETTEKDDPEPQKES